MNATVMRGTQDHGATIHKEGARVEVQICGRWMKATVRWYGAGDKNRVAIYNVRLHDGGSIARVRADNRSIRKPAATVEHLGPLVIIPNM